MTKKAWIYIVGGAVVIVLIILIAVLWSKSAKIDPGSQPINVPVGTGVEGSKTRLEVPANTKVPDSNSQVSADVAKPLAVSIAAPGVESKMRTFKVSVENNKFTPSNVIINVGDIAHIDFTAVDKDYDITQPDYGFKLNITEGETRLLEGQYTSPGKYIFYCAACGGPDKGPVGYITVVPK